MLQWRPLKVKLAKIFRNFLSRGERFEEMEEFLLSNNFGLEFTESLVKEVKEKKINAENFTEAFKDKVKDIIQKVDSSLHFRDTPPTVYLFIGSNGSGKTTTIAKIANLMKNKEKSVMIIAGDTFRSGAVEQLSKWASLLNVPIVKQKQGGDPASVIYDGLERGMSKKTDVILIDTAGRVETRKSLTEELRKIERVIVKKMGDKPAETLLVLDAYTGQSAVGQIEAYKDTVHVTGIVLTKFDGSSSGGVVIPIIEKYKIPVKFLGTGESIEDLDAFSFDSYLSKIL
jgi:fused signal recognition particle receptor